MKAEDLFLRPSLGIWGTGEKGHLFQGNKGQNFEGNKYNIGEQGTSENKFLVFGEQGDIPVYFKGTGTPLEGLIFQRGIRIFVPNPCSAT